MDQPELLPEFVAELAEWTRSKGAAQWLLKASSGSPFYWPKEIGNPTGESNWLRNVAYDEAFKKTRSASKAQEASNQVAMTMQAGGLAKLSAYHAETLDTAQITNVGKDITYLAAKTEMKDFRLDIEDLPAPRGFVLWDTPIGEAEPRGLITAFYEGGELESVDAISDLMANYRNSETPVVAASWRLLPEEDSVLVVFYTDGEKAKAFHREQAEQMRANLGPGEVVDTAAFDLYMSDPLPMEREQVLPLNRTMAWFHEKDQANHLEVTVTSDSAYMDAATRGGVEKDFQEANDRVLPMISQMVKTFVATLALRKMKLASRESIPAPAKSKKRMRRAGVGEERIESRVTVVRLGKPIQRRSKGDGESRGGKWKVKTIIGPVIRHTQYVPAHDEYRQGTWVIEPYVAGPADAPWSENAKVYLLD